MVELRISKMQNAKLKIFRNKKGINDISIISIILFIFLLTSISIEFVNAEFDTNIDTFDNELYEQNIRNDAESVNTFSAFSVLVTTLKLAFFDFGNTLGVPFWLDAMYSILAIILTLVIGRNIWVGGGA